MLRVEAIDLSEDRLIRELCPRLGPIPYSEFGVEKERLSDLTLWHIETQLAHPGSGLLGLVRSDGSLDGVAGYGLLEWDSTHFGLSMGRVHPFWVARDAGDAGALVLLEQAVADLTDQGVEQMYLRVNAIDMHSLRAACALGFFPVDVIVDYLFDFSNTAVPEKTHGLTTELASQADLDELCILARHTFENYFGRFHVDPGFFHDRATDMYVKWVQRSLSGDLADGVLVAKIDGRIAGFLTLRTGHEVGDVIGVRTGEGVLAGVAPFARGRGVYTAIIRDSLDWFKPRADKVRVATQVVNRAVQHAWTSLGFRLVNSYVTLHHWPGK